MAPVPVKPAVSRRYPPAPGRSRRFSGSECASEDGVRSVASTTVPDSDSGHAREEEFKSGVVVHMVCMDVISQ